MTHFSFHSPKDFPLAKSSHLTSLIPHVKTLHCPVNGCGKLFKKQEDLERHRAFHAKEKLTEGQTPSKLIPSLSAKSCDTTSTLESTIKHEEGCNDHQQQLLANRQELMNAIEHSRNSLNLINTQLTQLNQLGATQESLLGKRPNGFAEDPQEVDRMIKIAVIENDGLKKKLIVARATIAAFYKQLVFLESFLPRQN